MSAGFMALLSGLVQFFTARIFAVLAFKREPEDPVQSWFPL